MKQGSEKEKKRNKTQKGKTKELAFPKEKRKEG